MSPDNFIFGNSNRKYEPGDVVVATQKDLTCNLKIVRRATVEEYIDYMKRMNWDAGGYHGPYYYAGVSD